jgi:hypothetical protein
MKNVLQEYPKKARTNRNFQGGDWSIRTGLKKLRQTIRKMRLVEVKNSQYLRKARKALRKIRPTALGPDLASAAERCRRVDKEKSLTILRRLVDEGD